MPLYGDSMASFVLKLSTGSGNNLQITMCIAFLYFVNRKIGNDTIFVWVSEVPYTKPHGFPSTNEDFR